MGSSSSPIAEATTSGLGTGAGAGTDAGTGVGATGGARVTVKRARYMAALRRGIYKFYFKNYNKYVYINRTVDKNIKF